MPKAIFIIFSLVVFTTLTLNSCVNTKMTSSQSSSAEIRAKELTEKMTTELSLTPAQTEKVLLVNLVNYRIISKLIATNDTKKISSTQETYKSEIRQILTVSQYQKFLSSFIGLE